MTTPHPLYRCGQCFELAPLLLALHESGVEDAYIEPEMGGHVHAVWVPIDADTYALANLEGFSVYRGDDLIVSSDHAALTDDSRDRLVDDLVGFIEGAT